MSTQHQEALQTAVGKSHALPSIFEVLAQDNLTSSVRPAMHYLCKFIAGNFPERSGWILPWFDEIHLTFEALIQAHFLRAHSASFAEKYYAIQRVIISAANTQKISQNKKGFYLSLITLSLFPYLIIKLQKLYEKSTENDRRNLTNFGKVINFVYPKFYTIWQISKVYFQISFAVGKNDFHDPLLRLLRIKLVSQEMDLDSTGSFSSFVTRFLSSSVQAGVFILQFIHWWYTEDNQTQVRKITQNRPIPPPTPIDCDAAKNKSQCPICKKTATNVTATSTSGFVFCYTCIYRHIENNNACPVTGLPTSLHQLIKLYPPED